MIINPGRLYVDTVGRAPYLEADRIDVFEQGASLGALEAFRDACPGVAQAARIRDAVVHRFEVAASRKL